MTTAAATTAPQPPRRTHRLTRRRPKSPAVAPTVPLDSTAPAAPVGSGAPVLMPIDLSAPQYEPAALAPLKAQQPARSRLSAKLEALGRGLPRVSGGLALEEGQRLWRGPKSTDTALTAPVLTLEELGFAADSAEWYSPHVDAVALMPNLGTNLRSYAVRYHDGAVERSLLTPEGTKQGSYQLYYALPGAELSYSEGEPQISDSALLKEAGSFYSGLPCGNFSVWDENKVLICWGRYELIAAEPHDERAHTLELDLLALQEFLLGEDSVLGHWRAQCHQPPQRHKFRRHGSQAAAPQPPKPVPGTVKTQAIVVHYEGLSRSLPQGGLQCFNLAPASTALLLTRGPDETWLEACSRCHAQVLRLVKAQVAQLQARQQATRALYRKLNLTPAAPKTLAPICALSGSKLQTALRAATIAQGARALPQELLAPARHQGSAGQAALLSSLELLAQTQDAAIISGTREGGFAGLEVGYLTQGLTQDQLTSADDLASADEEHAASAQDPTYLGGLLVSSASYLEELCFLQLQPPRAPRRGLGLTPKGGLTTKLAPHDWPVPLWTEDSARLLTLPYDFNADLSALLPAFNWQAEGHSDVTNAQGEPIGWFKFGPLGLLDGNFALFNDKRGLTEFGRFELGLLTSHFNYVLFQNFQAGFPAASLTVERASGLFDGPYQVIFDLDDLFAAGYHRFLLRREEVWGPNGREVRNALAPYEEGSFIRVSGTYEQGQAHPEQSFELKQATRGRW